MKLYFAAPLFTAAERAWNEELAGALRDAGHEVFLPQEQELGMSAVRIFANDVDFRTRADGGVPYNAMLTESATIRLDLQFAPLSRIAAEVLDAVRRLDKESP